jgi:hypothetical protein
MKKPTKEMWYLMIGSIFGGIISLGIQLLYSEINNKWSWLMFFIGLIVFGLIARWVLSVFYKNITPEYNN